MKLNIGVCRNESARSLADARWMLPQLPTAVKHRNRDRDAMRVLTPMLLLASCRMPSVEAFTGLSPAPRAVQGQVSSRHTSVSTRVGVRQRRCAAGTSSAVMMAKPTGAELAKETKVDPAVVEAALVEEDKNV